mgnify:CR=1 FL=1
MFSRFGTCREVLVALLRWARLVLALALSILFAMDRLTGQLTRGRTCVLLRVFHGC